MRECDRGDRVPDVDDDLAVGSTLTWAGHAQKMIAAAINCPTLWRTIHSAHGPEDRDAGRHCAQHRIRGAHRAWRDDRAEGLDARALPQAARAHDVATCALRDRRRSEERRLDHARAEPAAQDGSPRESAG